MSKVLDKQSVDQDLVRRYYKALDKRDRRFEELYGKDGRQQIDALLQDCSYDLVLRTSIRRERLKKAHALWWKRTSDMLCKLAVTRIGDSGAGKLVPMAGDAVRLTTAIPGTAECGDIAVINGRLDKQKDALDVCFNYSAYRDDKIVSCSGGPSVWYADAGSMVYAGWAKIRFWRFKNDEARGGNGRYFEIRVPMWDWNGATKET